MRRLLATIALTIGLLIGIAAPSAQAAVTPYAGWKQPDRTVCVQLSTSRDWLRYRVREAAADWNDHTDLSMWVSSTCSGNKVTVRADYYGRNGKRAWATIWVLSGVVTSARVTVNLSYYAAGSAGDYAITHELGHTIGLGHNTSTCHSVMVPTWSGGCGVHESTWEDRYRVNRIY